MSAGVRTAGRETAADLLSRLGDGTMSAVAYDTAWFSRLTNASGKGRCPAARERLYRRQHADGSFGGVYAVAHDRVVATLAAAVALAGSPGDPRSTRAVARALGYLGRHAADVAGDPHETVGFELLLPRLLEEGRALGLSVPVDALGFVARIRAEKLRLVPPGFAYHPASPLAHNLEYLGDDLDGEAALRLTRANGSVANSPSASAYLAERMEDPRLNAYLDATYRASSDGGIPNVRPFEVFETAWVLRSLDWAGIRVPEGVPHLRRLSAAFGRAASAFRPPDSGRTPMTGQWRPRCCEPMGPSWATDFWPSTSGRLATSRFPTSGTRPCPPTFTSWTWWETTRLRRRRPPGAGCWPRWPGLAATGPTGSTSGMSHPSIRPPLSDRPRRHRPRSGRTQGDGGFGALSATREETAYALQALAIAGPSDEPAVGDALRCGRRFLDVREREVDPELWIGKGLYAPTLVIDAAEWSARRLVARRLGPVGAVGSAGSEGGMA